MDPEFTKHFHRGRALEMQRRYQEAVQEYEQAIRLNPADVNSWVNLGVVLRELGEDEDANQAFLVALDLQRGGPPLNDG